MTERPEAQAYAGLVQAIVATISLLLQRLHHVQMRALDYPLPVYHFDEEGGRKKREGRK